jgi:heme exporter protein A
LLRIIAGLVRLAGGRIALEGGNAELSIAEQAHYIGHQDPVKGALSVAENLTFWSSYLGGKPDVRSALKVVGLDSLADLPAGYLSAGQRRRLSLARLAAVKRPLWLLDEPTTALDTQAQKAFADLMRKHLRSGGLIVAASHGPIGISGTRQLRLGRA